MIESTKTSFCLYRRQPFVRLALQLSEGNAGLVFLAVILTIFLPKLISALLTGGLYSSHSPLKDFQSMFEPGVIAPVAELTLSRDYFDIVLTLIIAIYLTLLMKQWRQLSTLPAVLRQHGLISKRYVSDAAFANRLHKFDRLNSSVWLEVASLAIGVLLSATLLIYLEDSGLYPYLNPERESVMFHYSTWWANRDTNPFGYYFVIAIYGASTYMLFRHSLMGLTMVCLLLSIVSAAKQNGGKMIAYDDVWATPGVAIDEFKLSLIHVFVQIMLMSIAVVVISYYVPFGKVLTTIMSIYIVILNPIFIGVPIIMINSQLRDAKQNMTQRIKSKLKNSSWSTDRRNASKALLAFVKIQEEYRHALELPDAVIRWRTIGAGTVIYLVPIVAVALNILDIG